MTPRNTLKLKITPNAPKSQIIGYLGESVTLKIRLAATPEKGKANQALIKFLAKTLAIPKDQITITQGQTSPHKTILIQGLTKPQITHRLTPNTNT